MTQREIKFRVWDNEKKCFVPQGEIIFSFYGDTSITVVPNALEYIGDQCHNGEPQRGRFIVVEFIGLLDKNGVEIYEGFKLKDHSGYEWIVIWFDEHACFGVKSLQNGVVHEIIDNNNMEVIGNIFT